MNESLAALRQSIEKARGLMEIYDELASARHSPQEREEVAAEMIIAKENVLSVLLDVRRRIAELESMLGVHSQG